MEQKMDLGRLFDLLEQETSCYRQLIRDLKKEWECLKKDDPSTLSSLLRGQDGPYQSNPRDPGICG